MKRVEDSLGNMKSRAVHNSVMELRNIYHNHPYLSQTSYRRGNRNLHKCKQLLVRE
ncbi:unnamed protein product, partial [Brassica oleracea var. botrytis]